MPTRIALALLIAVLAGSLGACSNAATPVSRREPAALVAEPSAETTPSGDAWQLVRAKCTICHPIDRVMKARKDWAGWNKALDHMSKNGAPLSDLEKLRILQYLTNRK